MNTTSNAPDTQAYGDVVLVRRDDYANDEGETRPSYWLFTKSHEVAEPIKFNLKKDYEADVTIVSFDNQPDLHFAWLDVLDSFFDREFGYAILKRIVRIGLSEPY